MELLVVLIFLLIFFTFVTVIGHLIWLALAWFFRLLLDGQSKPQQFESINLDRCANCNALIHPHATACTACGSRKLSPAATERLKEISAARRSLHRLHQYGDISEAIYRQVLYALEREQERLTAHTTPAGEPARPAPQRPATQTPQPSVVEARPPAPRPPESIVEEDAVHRPAASGDGGKDARTPVEIFINESQPASPPVSRPPRWDARQEQEERPPRPEPVVVRKARRPLSEVLAAFMEQSNIRWGEIIGGLLIIGCSTALVISLWNEISRIPVLKFFIFTTVTAALFGVGLYTEHRWKLPTTSRGILTIATMLVPLNFLAIAAVSKGNIPAGSLVLASELIAPALFLCLVFFAGRIITQRWPHLLVFGVLGASVGQLLIRHFAFAEMSPERLLLLGLFPLACYVAAMAWMLKSAGREEEFDESLANTIFVTLGASTFASLLSLGLLIFKAGERAETLMHLAPLLTLGGGPVLASGLLLWQRIKSRQLNASRTAGTSIALIGALLMLAGIFLSFPNPASVVLAAFLAFAIFTGMARFFEQPRAHLFAAFCFALGFVVSILATTGQIAWQSSRNTSLLSDLLSGRSGQATAMLFLFFIAASELLRARRQEEAGKYYAFAAIAVGAVCLALTTLFGLRAGDTFARDPFFAAPVYALLASGAFFLAWRFQSRTIAWFGSGILLLALGQTLEAWLVVRFPWQAAMLLHASVASIAAIYCWRKEGIFKRDFAVPLNVSALITSLAAVFLMFEAYRWEPTSLYAQRLLWLAGIWLVLLWLNRSQFLFTAMQIALTCAVVLFVKLGLQNYVWYAYVRHAWLNPWSLQIQGSVLVMLGLAWAGVRFFVKSRVAAQARSSLESDAVKDVPQDVSQQETWASVAGSYLNSSWPTFDRLMTGAVLLGFVLLGIYGALNGIKVELMIRGGATSVWNLAGFPHQHAYGAGAWILLALLLVSMLAGFWERRRFIYAAGALLVLATAVPLLAARWEEEFATASAWRWLAAVFLILLSLPLWWREKVASGLHALGLPEGNQEASSLAMSTRAILLLLTLAPLLALTIYPVLKVIWYRPVHSPGAGFFYQIGEVVSYTIPLVLASLALVGHAMRERFSGYAFSAGLLINLAVTVAQLLTIAAVGGSMNRVVLVQVMQLNAIASAGVALVWLATRGWWTVEAEQPSSSKVQDYLKIQVGIALVINSMLIVPLAVWLFERPTRAGMAVFEAGNLRGWLALLLSTLAAFWFVKAFNKKLGAWLLFATAGAAGVLVSFDFVRLYAGTWAGYHAFLTASVVTAWLMLLARKLPARLEKEKAVPPVGTHEVDWRFFKASWQWDATLFATIAGMWAVLMALRAAPDDPARPFWSVGALVAMSVLAAALNWETLQRAYLYVAGMLLNLAATIWVFTRWPHTDSIEGLFALAEANLVMLALPGIIWLWLELRARRLDQNRQSLIPAFHHVAAIIVLTGIFYLAGIRLLVDLLFLEFAPRVWLEWLAVGSSLALMLACLWDRRARFAVVGLYLLGIAAAGFALGQANLNPRWLLWLMMLTLSAYTLLTSFIWKARAPLMEFAEKLGIPRRDEKPLPGLDWLRILNAVLASVVVFLTFWSVLEFAELPVRMAGATAVIAQTLTFVILAKGERRYVWQQCALLMLALGAVFFGWAWLAPGINGTWLNRAVMLMIVMFGMIALYGLGTERQSLREAGWTQAARSFIPTLAGAGAIALVFVLVTEVTQQTQFGGVRINLPALVVVGATLLAASMLCIFFAVRPAHDPLELSESGRMKYVYVAEGLLALLFMHIRLTMPWLFSGFFEKYWPLVIVFLAFVGVGIAETLRRQGVMVVARPVERTGVFLPLLPVIGFWIVDSRVDYSLVLFMIGLLYASLSILRRSFVFGMLAALAGNGGLWYMLQKTESYGFFQHPQIWLIPVALSVLIAAYLNRERFTEEQMTGIRYITLMMIYVSSTSDIFINGVAESPWLPLALAGLSLAGVLCGIMFRVRAFLFLGAMFLLIAVISMIWYASVNLGWTWLWYVAGIATGALIIFTFALFEKKRSEMLQVLEDLRGWQK
jgi:hypothetical protein